MGRKPKSDLPAALASAIGIVGANIHSLREQSGLSQAELARRAKISTTTLNGIETTRRRDLRLSTLVVIAEALGCQVARLCMPSDLEVLDSDQRQLLKVSDELVRITRKIRTDPSGAS